MKMYIIELEEHLVDKKEYWCSKAYQYENFNPKFIINSEIAKWLNDNSQGDWFVGNNHIYFIDEEDAMAFRLRWV